VTCSDWSRIGEVPGLVAALYAVVDDLEEIFPGRHFTPDGHLIGSIGESLAAYLFDVDLNVASTTAYDATLGDLKIEVKATQGRAVSISAADRVADHLVAIRLDRHNPPEVVFNGPAVLAWEAAGQPQKNGQRVVSLANLRALQLDVAAEDQLPQVRALDGIGWGS
jgi:hypothetical protein